MGGSAGSEKPQGHKHAGKRKEAGFDNLQKIVHRVYNLCDYNDTVVASLQLESPEVLNSGIFILNFRKTIVKTGILFHTDKIKRLLNIIATDFCFRRINKEIRNEAAANSGNT